MQTTSPTLQGYFQPVPLHNLVKNNGLSSKMMMMMIWIKMWQMYSSVQLIKWHWISYFKMAGFIAGKFHSNEHFLEKEYNEN